MNFFPNVPNFDNMNNGVNGQILGSNGMDLFYKISELENKIMKLEQRIVMLENEKENNYFNESDTSMYMI